MTKKSNNTIITASASFVSTPPRKVNLVLKSIVGQDPLVAIEILQFVPNRAAKFVTKLLKQALGNASDQHKLASSDLVVFQAYATKASTSRRMRFAGRGRTQPYLKTTSHMTVVLKAKNASVPAPKKSVSKPKKEVKAVKNTKTVKKTTSKKTTTKKVNTKTKIK